MTVQKGALAGIRVIELASYVSGPFAGMMLGDFGAEVIKIESPGGGDPFRGWGTGGYSPTFGSVNRNKKSVTIDLKSDQGRAAARRLIDGADVLIENFRAGTLERLGLGYETLSQSNPRLVYCAITGFGETGPYAARAGYDTVGQAMGGLLSLLTDMGDPKPMGISLSDHLSGMVACNGILAALQARERTGRGQRVDTSLLEATVSFIGENAANYFESGRVPDRATRTRRAQVFAFVDSEGKPFVIHLSSPPKFFEGLTRVVERPEWLVDARFASRKARMERPNYEAFRTELAAIFRSRPRAHWLARLEAEDVPSGPIYDLGDLFEDPQVQKLGLKVAVQHADGSTRWLVRNGVRLSDTPTAVSSPAPELGQHTEELLGGKRSGE